MVKWHTLAAALVCCLSSVGCSALLGINNDYVQGDAQAELADGSSPGDGGASDGSGGGDAGAGDGASTEGGDAGCAGHICSGVCVGPAGSTCETCAGANIFCPGSNICMSDCRMCAGGDVACFTCTGATPVGTCNPHASAYCLSGAPYDHCACAGPSSCPGANQVCSPDGGGLCYACGEAQTDNRPCKQGGYTCDQGAAHCGN